MQDAFNCYFFVANWHSLTTHPDTKELQANVLRVIAENIACGLDPEKVALYVQSDVPQIAELYLYLNMMAYKGELEKTVTFKEKVRLQPENVNAGLLTYPVLQAADILIHRAVKVPVGKDQEQHLEMARTYAERFNHRYGEVLPLPYAFNYGGELVKIMSLDGEGKMSKSDINEVYFYVIENLPKEPRIEIFSVISSMFDISADKFYECLSNTFKTELITELKSRGFLTNRNSLF
jgi:tryptophanyl-tRNA synthetase